MVTMFNMITDMIPMSNSWFVVRMKKNNWHFNCKIKHDHDRIRGKLVTTLTVLKSARLMEHLNLFKKALTHGFLRKYTFCVGFEASTYTWFGYGLLRKVLTSDLGMNC